jgi:trimethylamine---corrinoid protein Co-methyltransferase
VVSIKLSLLSSEDIGIIHSTSLQILEEIGVKITSGEVLSILEGREGISIDYARHVVKFRESAIQSALIQTPHTFKVYGRDKTRQLSYGTNHMINHAIPGEYHWVDPIEKVRREGTVSDFEKSVIIADALPNIDVVGAMIQPVDVPIEIRDIYLYAELLKRTRKPVRSWVLSRRSARYILEMLKVVAGGANELRANPLTEFGIEPISPLQMPPDALETTLEFARAGIPITIGPMPQAMATAPVTLAGAIAQGNAESLATLVIIQAIAPGIPVVYFNSPHIMDPRTMSLVFGSPEQGLMGIAAAELGKYYNLPVGVNVGITDAKVPDAQAGLEKGTTLLLGALAGADVFGGMGISGCDQGFSPLQLIVDDETIGFVKRIMSGIRIDRESCAYDVIDRVGIAGSFMTDDHTLSNWRKEFWIPQLCDRNFWDKWLLNGGKSMLDRSYDRQEKILREHELEWLDEDTQRELDKIVTLARQEILG